MAKGYRPELPVTACAALIVQVEASLSGGVAPLSQQRSHAQDHAWRLHVREACASRTLCDRAARRVPGCWPHGRPACAGSRAGGSGKWGRKRRHENDKLTPRGARAALSHTHACKPSISHERSATTYIYTDIHTHIHTHGPKPLRPGRYHSTRVRVSLHNPLQPMETSSQLAS